LTAPANVPRPEIEHFEDQILGQDLPQLVDNLQPAMPAVRQNALLVQELGYKLINLLSMLKLTSIKI